MDGKWEVGYSVFLVCDLARRVPSLDGLEDVLVVMFLLVMGK